MLKSKVVHVLGVNFLGFAKRRSIFRTKYFLSVRKKLQHHKNNLA
jgi:hypothetical protein